MHLLIDIGNTSIKWATFDGVALGTMGSARHHGALPMDLIAAWDALVDIDTLLIGRVGPVAVESAVLRVAQSCWGANLRRVACAAVAHGVRVAYAQPARLGVDRFLALIGAHWFASAADRPAPADATGPRLIVDAGTAITFDLLDANGGHRGGLILPGVGAMRDTLFVGTQIPRYEPTDATQPWATDTAEAIAAASLHAPAALAGRLYQRLAADTGQTPLLLLTGGDAERLLPVFEVPATLVPDLVLRGLSRFAATPDGV